LTFDEGLGNLESKIISGNENEGFGNLGISQKPLGKTGQK